MEKAIGTSKMGYIYPEEKKISNKFKVHNIENISDIMRFKDEFQFKK